MKNFLLAILLSLTTLTAQAGHLKTYPHDTVFLDNLDILLLGEVENKQLTIWVPYPGNISNNCSLLMRTASGIPLKPLLDRLIITSTIPAKPEVKGTIIYPLPLETYLGGITVQTIDGKSLAENVHAAFPPQGTKSTVDYNEVGFIADVCHRKLPE